MDIFLRTIAIIIELLILVVIAYVILHGARLTVFDLGLSPRYKKAVAMVLLIMGSLVVIFFIAHLITFYPET